MKKNDLIKYINGSLSEAEQKEVLGWIEKNESNRRYFHSLKESYILMTLPEDPVSEQDYAEFLHKYPSVKRGAKCRCLSARHYMLAAAIAVLFIALGLIFRHTEQINGNNKITIANNTTEIIFSQLPDGSSVALSPDSKVRYRKDFGKAHRKIYFKGTCFFNVAKNTEIPFKVKAAGKNILIEVTGTKFYASSSCDTTLCNQFELSLLEGSVNVKTCNNGVKQHIKMTPGEHLDITRDYRSTISHIGEHGNHLMKDMMDYLNFKNEKLSHIVKKLETLHNCRFQIIDPSVGDHLLTANLANNSLEDILTIFEVTMNITSRVNNEGVIELY